MRLPGESSVYIADNAWCPYGPRPADQVVERARLLTRNLVARGCKLVVVACNTATAAAIGSLRREFNLPFVGMEPAIKPAVEQTRSGVVAVLATQGTLRSALYHHTLQTVAGGVRVIEQEGKGWVEAVEAGELSGPRTLALVAKSLEPLLALGVDQLVLGCTHYPFLIPLIREVAGPAVDIIDPAPAVLRQVRKVLAQRGLLAPEAAWASTSASTSASNRARHSFYSTGETAPLDRSLQLLASAPDFLVPLQEYQTAPLWPLF